DDAVKRSAIVEPLVRQLFEILDGFWCYVGPEGESHFPVGSLDDGVFCRGFGGAHKRRSEPLEGGARKNISEERPLPPLILLTLRCSGRAGRRHVERVIRVRI